MEDVLIAALESGSSSALGLLADRLERLAGLRHRMVLAAREMPSVPALARASSAVLEALDVHVGYLQQALRQVQQGSCEAALQGELQASWERLVALQRTLGT